MGTINFGHVKGLNGQGVPAGGAAGQILRKIDATDYNALWGNLSANDVDALPSDAITSNLLINGSFDIWQRGTTQTAPGYGSDDRWDNFHSVSSKTHSRQAFAIGQIDVPRNPTYFSRTDVVSGGTAASRTIKSQRIENAGRFSGKTVTLSFYAKADANKSIAVEFSQNYGSGGSAPVNGITQKIAITNSWALYTVTVTLPDLAGKTIGDGSLTQVCFWFDAGSDYNARTNSLGNQSGTFDIANVQLNYGSVALPFVPRSYDDELRLCQRYCRPLAGYIFRAIICLANSVFFPMKPISTGMRLSTPTIISSDWSLDNMTGMPQTGFSFGSHTNRDIVLNKTSHGMADCILYFNSGYADCEI